MIRMTNLAIVFALASGVLALTPPVFAAQVDEEAPASAQVNVAKVDFTSPHAVAVLEKRVRYVARQICTAKGDGSGHMSADEVECFKVAVNTAEAQIESRRAEALSHLPTRTMAANTVRTGH